MIIEIKKGQGKDQNAENLSVDCFKSQFQKQNEGDLVMRNKQGYKKLVLNRLENSPEVSQLLVKLHDHSRLYEMAKSDDQDSREELVTIMADLLQFKLSEAGSELIADVLLGLINKAELELRHALAERLAVIKEVPLRIVLKLANDEIKVAKPILKKSMDLTDFDLIYILKANGSDHWQAIAERPEISDKLILMLAETLDVQTAINLTQNQNIILDERSLSSLTDMAVKSETLSKGLLTREEISLNLVTKIYEVVGDELKDFIKENFKSLDIQPIESEIDSLVREFSNIEKGQLEPDEDLVQKAEYMLKNDLLSAAVMVDHLRQGQLSTFIAQMSVCCGFPTATIERIIAEKTGRDLAAACTLAKMEKSDFINIFLLTSRVRDTRIICESDLSCAIKCFDKMDERIALQLLQRNRH